MQRKNNCPWCIHTQGMVWEHRIWQGEDVETVAAETPFSLDAAHHHVREHMGLALSSAPLVTEERTASRPVAIPGTPAQADPAATGSALSAYAAELLLLASKVVASADVANESGSLDSAMRDIETRGQALGAIAESLGIDAFEAEQTLIEVTATVRGVLRAEAAGLGTDLDFLATLIREEGGHRIAHDIEERVRARQRA